MLDMPAVTHPVRTRADIARLLGLPARSANADIARKFRQMTRFTHDLELEEVEIRDMRAERWQLRVYRDREGCRLEARRGGRGEWLRAASGIPEQVMMELAAYEDRSGKLRSARSWQAWVRRSGRKLGARARVLEMRFEIDAVARPTGEHKVRLSVVPIDAEYAQKVQIDLPARSTDILARIREAVRPACAQVPAVSQ